MDKLPIPEYDEVPLDAIGGGVHGLRILFVNVYAVESALGGWVLIDSGLPFSADRIRKWTGQLFGANARPRCILQTHGHFDHVGGLLDLSREWDVPVYAHPDEFPFLSGISEYPPPDLSVGGGLMTLMSPLYPRGPVNVGDRLRSFETRGEIADLPGWQWIHTSGHTPGHVSFFREQDRMLLVGDAFCTADQRSFLDVAAQKPELTGPPAYYTPDWVKAKESVGKLAELRPKFIVPGHGLPMRGAEVEEGLQKLAVDFDRIARAA